MKKSKPSATGSTLPTPVNLTETPLPVGSSYWTLSISAEVSPMTAATYRVPPAKGYPHGLTSHQCGTAKELMDALAKVGRKPAQFTSSTSNFARVEITLDGFRVTRFPSFAAAHANDQGENPARASKILPACPFCNCFDRVEIINWSNERADGSEYIGRGARCNRCDAVAPLPAWRRLGKIPA